MQAAERGGSDADENSNHASSYAPNRLCHMDSNNDND